MRALNPPRRPARHHALVSLLSLSLALGACASAPPAPTVSLSASAPASAAVSREPEAPASVIVPAGQGCVLPTTSRHALRVRADGPWFAITMGAAGTIDLTTGGPAAGAVVRVARAGVSVMGLVPGDEIRLFPSRALVLGGFVVPTTEARLPWKGTSLGEIAVSFAPSGVELLADASLDTTRLPCSAVTVGVPRFDPLSVLPRSTREADFELRRGAPVPLSRRHDEPPVARLLPDDEPESVTVIKARGSRSLIRRVRGDAVIFGWIPTSALGPAGSIITEHFTHGDGFTMDPDAEPARGTMRCDRALPIVAVVGGERRTVGAVAPRTELTLLAPRGDLTPFVLPRGLVDLNEGAVLGLRLGLGLDGGCAR